MAIQRLKNKPKEAPEKAIEAFIQKGGATTTQELSADEVRMTLRLPPKLVEQLDVYRKRSPGFVSRNSLILQLIQEFLESNL